MQSLSDPFPAAFRTLLDRIKAEIEAEAFEEALAVADRAMAWAEQAEDRACLDRATANRLGLKIFLGHRDVRAQDLQTIVMRARQPRTRYQAAYDLSLFYLRRERYDRGLFYAKLALDTAARLDDDRYRLAALNRLGNLQLVQCFFEEALETYRRAHDLMTPMADHQRVHLHANLGYCYLMLERIDEAFEELISARRMIRRLGLPTLEARTGLRLTLCYAFLERDRPRLARKHGLRALAQGEANGDDALIKKALYLLGEAEKKAGDREQAYAYFDRLESLNQPERTGLADLLMAVESHRLVNLKA